MLKRYKLANGANFSTNLKTADVDSEVGQRAVSVFIETVRTLGPKAIEVVKSNRDRQANDLNELHKISPANANLVREKLIELEPETDTILSKQFNSR